MCKTGICVSEIWILAQVYKWKNDKEIEIRKKNKIIALKPEHTIIDIDNDVDVCDSDPDECKYLAPGYKYVVTEK